MRVSEEASHSSLNQPRHQGIDCLVLSRLGPTGIEILAPRIGRGFQNRRALRGVSDLAIDHHSSNRSSFLK